ncbi:perlucin-like protein [Ruditapes philippinarum]|uniref:perlucin-like protein n=1 Tax=Ruditapes philippinarum TaxID=129788 RepID=UPI00295B0442|nr:perlucin-like protein [Ruditapes philippinarum]
MYANVDYYTISFKMMTGFSKWTFLLGLVFSGLVQCTDCPDGWVAYEGSCYLFGHGVTQTFVESEHFCRQHHNGHLVEIDSKAENLFLKDYVRGFGGHCYWIGLSDEQIEGNWIWYHSNTTPLFFDWGPSQPDPGNNEDCAIFWGPFDYLWGDLGCDWKCQPVCKISGGETASIVG